MSSIQDQIDVVIDKLNDIKPGDELHFEGDGEYEGPIAYRNEHEDPDGWDFNVSFNDGRDYDVLTAEEAAPKIVLGQEGAQEWVAYNQATPEERRVVIDGPDKCNHLDTEDHVCLACGEYWNIPF